MCACVCDVCVTCVFVVRAGALVGDVLVLAVDFAVLGDVNNICLPAGGLSGLPGFSLKFFGSDWVKSMAESSDSESSDASAAEPFSGPAFSESEDSSIGVSVELPRFLFFERTAL